LQWYFRNPTSFEYSAFAGTCTSSTTGAAVADEDDVEPAAPLAFGGALTIGFAFAFEIATDLGVSAAGVALALGTASMVLARFADFIALAMALRRVKNTPHRSLS
jgi:hypothetical protein